MICSRAKAGSKVQEHLSGYRKKIFFWVLKHARKAVKNRQNTRDVFWLTIEEIFGIYNGTLPSYNLDAFVALRKESYGKFEIDPDPRVLTRGAVYWNNPFVSDEEVVSNIGEGEDCDLKGLPCCPGILEGTVKVILNPGEN